MNGKGTSGAGRIAVALLATLVGLAMVACYWPGEFAQCLDDSECASSQICTASLCVDGCREDSACGVGKVCEDLKCLVGCRDDSTCGSGNICEKVDQALCDQYCASSGWGVVNEYCQSMCKVAQCLEGCRSDEGCESAYWCNNRQCRFGCRSDEFCPVGFICEEHVCLAGCRGDTGCEDGFICQDGACVARKRCGQDADCGAGSICVDQLCEVGCRLDGDCGSGFKCVGTDCMALVPAGPFWMGCHEEVEIDPQWNQSWCNDDEKPYHEVTLAAYYIDRTEVTQGAYNRCVNSAVCSVPSYQWEPVGNSDKPAAGVTWEQADQYCRWASKSLPTEAQWEKAARGTEGFRHPWGNEWADCEHAVMKDCDSDTAVVCSKSPAGDSPYGLCDMSGNVWEWVSDWYDSGYYAVSFPINPTGPTTGSYHVQRGGDFNYYGIFGIRVSGRTDGAPSRNYTFIQGFRCAAVVE